LHFILEQARRLEAILDLLQKYSFIVFF